MEHQELFRLHPSLLNSLGLFFWPALALIGGCYLINDQDAPTTWYLYLTSILMLFPLYAWFRSICYTYVIRPESVMSRQGILKRFSTEIRIADIRAISIQQNLYERILGIGDVGFSTSAGDEEEVTFLSVRRPDKLKLKIQTLQRQLNSEPASPDNSTDNQAV